MQLEGRLYESFPEVWQLHVSELQNKYVFFSVAQKRNSCLGCLIVGVSRSHTFKAHTHSVGLLWTSGQLVADRLLPKQHTTNTRQAIYRTYDITIRNVRVIIFSVESSNYYRQWICVCSFSYRECTVRFSTASTHGRIFEKKKYWA